MKKISVLLALAITVNGMAFINPTSTITATISGDNSGQYTYTIKTGKLKKK